MTIKAHNNRKTSLAFNPCGATLVMLYTGCMCTGGICARHEVTVGTGGVAMKRSMRLTFVGFVLGVLAQPALAFQESTVGSQAPAEQPAATLEATKPTVDPGKGVTLSVPEVSIGKSSGTEVRIPGLGKVGVLPKLDFGLELLYGATESKGMPQEKSEPSDVQIRGTIKHRF